MLISLGASTNIKDRKGRTPGDFKTYFDTKVLLKIGNTTFFHPSICFHLSLLPSSHLAHCGAEKGQLETVQVLTEHKSIKKKKKNYLNLSNKKLLAEAGGTLWDENGTGDLPLHEVRIF